MWVEDVDDITVEYEQDGVLLIKQEDKRIVSRGTWSTIVFLYRDWNRKSEEFGPIKFTLRKYRKQRGTYRQESKFNIGSTEQAKSIADILKEWAEKG